MICHLVCLSSKHRNLLDISLKSPIYVEGRPTTLMCHLVCLSSHSRNLSVLISNHQIMWGISATWSVTLICLSSQNRNLSEQISNCHILGGLDLLLDLSPGLPELSSSRNLSISNLKLPIYWGARSATWSATWSAWALTVGIYQYESQITIFWGGYICHLICHLVCLSS